MTTTSNPFRPKPPVGEIVNPHVAEHVPEPKPDFARLAAEPPIDLDYKLPCEVRLPIGMSIGKGVPLRTLLIALRQRESWPDEDTRFQDDRAKAVRSVLGIPHGCSGQFASFVPDAPKPECICPACGIRHGGSNVDGGF